jgi:hypothetical protein
MRVLPIVGIVLFALALVGHAAKATAVALSHQTLTLALISTGERRAVRGLARAADQAASVEKRIDRRPIH